MKAKRTFSNIDSGSGFPCCSLSMGFGSNRSMCEGAPAMKMKMHAFAFGSKCGGRGARGLTPAGWLPDVSAPAADDRTPSCDNIAPNAAIPSPLAVVFRNSRRVCVTTWSVGYWRRVFMEIGFPCQSRTMNSSRFITIRSVATQAAFSAVATSSTACRWVSLAASSPFAW